MAESAIPLPDEPSTSASRQKNFIKTSDASAIMDLKGELYRKRAEQRSRAEARMTQTAPKRNILLMTKEEERQKLEESSKRQKRIEDLEKGLREEEEARLKAKKILEEKSEIYNRLSRGEKLAYEDGQSVEFMVDFEAKKREENERREEELRREKEEAEKNEATHFVANEEQRVYGVSHVQFSISEQKRQQQMQELLDLTKKTEEEREKRKRLLEERKRAKLERLNAVRLRKGLEPLPMPDEKDEEEEVVGPFLDIPMPSEPEPSKHDEKIDRIAQQKKYGVREWDKGKGMIHEKLFLVDVSSYISDSNF
ncbi:unnamed protein product [Anisakis simplex]|uniref:PLD phosphodiesterase domain-containing protein n=1 Tax=Anisakis simplex TaxID=6269 RepID=A0A0M3K8U0_ANISI|nr:unnamed protein product [Anisakis simplex]